MKLKTCCFTGHRQLPNKDQNQIARKLESSIELLIQSGYLYFGAGGALGFDTLAAKTILQLQERYPQIRLILVLPCISQANLWPAADIAVYQKIMEQANKVVYISQKYTPDCMLRRNRHLVDYSSVCICYLNKTTGGTAYKVKYAQKCGLQIINIAEGLSMET